MKLPPYSVFPRLQGDKVSLREVLNSDIKDLIEISFYDSVPAKNIEEARRMQERIDKDYEDGDGIHRVIIDNETDKIVGTCGYYRGFQDGAGELGCVLLPQYRGQGFMTPAMQLAIDYGKNDMNLSRIWAATSRKNEKAISLLGRLNFHRVAILPDDEIEFEFITTKE